MKFSITTEVFLEHNNPEQLQQILQPENATMKDGEVTSSVAENGVVTQIRGYMSIGTLLNTIDDILKTSTLADNVVESTKDTGTK